MAKTSAQVEITASSSRLAAGLSQASSKFRSFAAGVGRRMGSLFGKGKDGFSTAKGAVASFGGDMIGKGIDAIAGAAEGVREFESDMQRLGQATHQSDAQMAALAESLKATSIATGINRNELAKAASVYFDKTSDVEGMAKALDVFAMTAQASGAATQDLVGVAAAMKDSMKMDSSEFLEAFGGLIAQGEAGKVTLKELAAEAPSLMAMFSKFNTGKEGLMQMNAAFQVGAKAFGSASQAATGLEAMMGMLQARQSQLAQQGVKVFKVNKDGTVVMRNMQDIVADIGKKNIDPRKWGKVFGENKEGRNFLETLLKYPDLYKQITDAGSQAGVVQEYAMNRAASRAGRLDLALNQMKESVANAFTPERIEAFTRGVEAAAEHIGNLVEGLGFIADGLGALSGVGKSIRGALSGSGNMFREQMFTNRVERGMSPILAAGKGDMSKGDVALQRNAAGWDAAVAKILGSERDERTTKDSVRAAYISSKSEGGYENLGAKIAGDQYLRNAGVTKEQAEEAWKKEVIASNEKGLAMIAAAIAGMNPKVQIGDNQNARSVNKATHARRSP